MSTHKAAFDICNALIAADNGATGLNNTASDAHLRGGFAMVGDPQRTNSCPYIDFEIASDREVDAMPNPRVDMIVRFHVFTDRNTAFIDTVPGNQHTVVARLRTVFHRVAAGSAGGWTGNTFYRIGGQQAPTSDTKCHYVETYHLRLSA